MKQQKMKIISRRSILYLMGGIASSVLFTQFALAKPNLALQRIKDGTYGFCEETGEPIGLKRLMARPVAKYTIAAQEKHEKDEKVHADD